MQQQKRFRILIADEYRLFTDACKYLLEPEYEVVGLAHDGYQFLNLARSLKPDAAVINVALPRLNGLDAGEQLKRALPTLKLIFTTGTFSPAAAADAFRIGASGYVLKNADSAEFLTAIRKSLNGENYVSPVVVSRVIEFIQNGNSATLKREELSFRQRSVLQLLVEGASMKETAAVLNITPSGVAAHKYRLMRQLGVSNDAELIRFAVQFGIV